MASHPRRAPVSTDKRLRKTSAKPDQGTPERWQHSTRVLQLTDSSGVLAARAAEEHILDILGLNLLLTALQVEAGLKLRSDYQQASLAARVAGSYSGMPKTSDFYRYEHQRSDTEEAAYRRWRHAVEELEHPFRTVVVSTVCFDFSPRPHDIPLLQKGLEKLALWYRIAKKAPLQPYANKRG